MKINTDKVYKYDIRGFFEIENKWITVQKGQGTKADMNRDVKKLKNAMRNNPYYRTFYGIADTSPIA